MRTAGLEPALPNGKRILSPLRLPFRHVRREREYRLPKRKPRVRSTGIFYGMDMFRYLARSRSSRQNEIMTAILSIAGLSKTYKSKTGGEPHRALVDVDLDIERGEIFALLGPNGAGKTTLISIVCGIVMPSGGSVTVDGFDHRRDFRRARSMIGLVPQELHTDAFEKVIDTVNFSRGLFGKRPDAGYIEGLLRDLTLWDKRNAKIMELSGGMKRRVMIAKALSHEPDILFLDEPSAGVDVELRRDMWAMVRSLRERGVTIILTTHYIEEAEEMADRVGVISQGRLILVDEKAALMKQLGRKTLTLNLAEPLAAIPAALGEWELKLADDGHELVYEFDTHAETTGVPSLLRAMSDSGIAFKDLNTRQSSLEDIFLGLVHKGDTTSDAAQAERAGAQS